MLSLHKQQKENLRIQPQDYITTKQCLFLSQLKFFLLPGISKTGEIWQIEHSAVKNWIKLHSEKQIKHCTVVFGISFYSGWESLLR